MSKRTFRDQSDAMMKIFSCLTLLCFDHRTLSEGPSILNQQVPRHRSVCMKKHVKPLNIVGKRVFIKIYSIHREKQVCLIYKDFLKFCIGPVQLFNNPSQRRREISRFFFFQIILFGCLATGRQPVQSLVPTGSISGADFVSVSPRTIYWRAWLRVSKRLEIVFWQ